MHSSQSSILWRFVVLDGLHSRSDRSFRVTWAHSSQSGILWGFVFLDGSLSRSDRWCGEKCNLGIVFYPLFKVWPLGQRVHWVSSAGLMLDDIMIFLSDLVPSGLPVTKILEFGKILQIFMIREDCEWLMGVQEILAPFLKCKDNG